MGSLPLVLALVCAPPAAAPSLGERALSVSFHHTAPAGAAELARQMSADLLRAMDGPPEQRKIIGHALAETFGEAALYARAGEALEKAMPRKDIERALSRVSPQVAELVRDAWVKESGDDGALLWEALKQPNAEAREVQALHVLDHIPDAVSFREMGGVVVGMVVDIAVLATGDESKRSELRETYWRALEPAAVSLENRDAILKGALVAYRKRSLDDLKALATTLDDPAVSKLSKASAKAVVAGAEEARRRVIARLKAELAPKKK